MNDTTETLRQQRDAARAALVKALRDYEMPPEIQALMLADQTLTQQFHAAIKEAA